MKFNEIIILIKHSTYFHKHRHGRQGGPYPLPGILPNKRFLETMLSLQMLNRFEFQFFISLLGLISLECHKRYGDRCAKKDISKDLIVLSILITW